MKTAKMHRGSTASRSNDLVLVYRPSFCLMERVVHRHAHANVSGLNRRKSWHNHCQTLSMSLQATTTPAAEKAPGSRKKIGILGCGQMSEALLRGFLSSGACCVDDVAACVRSQQRKEVLHEMGITTIYGDALNGGAEELAAWADIVILGVKPQVLPPVLKALAPYVDPARHLVVSIAAGIKLSTLQSALAVDVPIVRVMPNTPSLVQEGATAFALGRFASQRDGETIKELLDSVGLTIQVEEKMMSAVTGVSGSGPAYVYMMIEAMADGGVAAGLPRNTALALAAKTVAGAARMVLQEDKAAGFQLTHPGVLKDKVTSPAGTTIAAVESLEASGIRSAFIKAVLASSNRSEELG